MNKLQHWIEYIVLRLVETVVRLTPMTILRSVAGVLGMLIFRLIGYRRQVTLENLAVAFPEMSVAERLKIARGCYRHFVLLIFEFIKFAFWPVERLEQLIEIENAELMRKCADDPGGTIFLAGHHGNWEIATKLCQLFWARGVLVQQRQSNRLVDARTADIRRTYGLDILHSRGVVREGLARLGKGELICLIADQDGGSKGVFAPFFGKMASSHSGPGLLALRGKANVLYGFCARIGPLKYRWVTVELAAAGELAYSRENMAELTRRYNAALEMAIREYPDQYLWLHKRWKTNYDPAAARSGIRQNAG